MSEKGIDWNEIRATLERVIPRSVATWRRLPELLESGRLVKKSSNWYLIKDPRVLGEISHIAKGFKIDKARKLMQVKLTKPSKLLIDVADRLAARDRAGA